MQSSLVSSLENTDYFWSFLLGFAFIALYARDRLYVRIDEKDEQRNRMIDLLEPSKLVRRKMFWRGLIIYFFLLSMIYVTLCALSHPLFPVIDRMWPEFWQVFGYDNNDGNDMGAASPAIPLIVSMAVMGLLPQLPWVKRLEEIARRVTLRLVSIPDSFNDLTDALFYTDFDPEKLPTKSLELIDQTVAQMTALPQISTSPLITRKCIIKHQFFLKFMDNYEAWPETDVKREFQSIWADINERALALEKDLEDLIKRSELTDDNSDAATEALVGSWNVMAKRLRRIADDICALLAIYSENSRGLPKRRFAAGTTVETDQREHDEGLEELRQHIITARSASDQSQRQFTLALFSTLVACIALFVVGFLGSFLGVYTEFAAYEMTPLAPVEENAQGRDPVLLAMAAGVLWLFGGALTYLPAALVAWGVRLKLDACGEWTDVYHFDNMTYLQEVGFYCRVFWPAYMTALLCLGVLTVIAAATRAGDASVLSNWGLSWGDAFTLMTYSLLGGIYAVSLVRFFDISETVYAENRQIRLAHVRRLLVLTLVALMLATAFGTLAQTFASTTFSNPLARTELFKELGFKLFSAFVFGALSFYLTLVNLNDLRKSEARRRKMRGTDYGEVRGATL